jgi:CHAD domain-containing protein
VLDTRARDEDAIHDLRVATRRCDAALRLYGRWIPDGRAVRREMKVVRDLAGAVRDLDVALPHLSAVPDGPCRRRIRDRCMRYRRKARGILLAHMAGTTPPMAPRVRITPRVPLGELAATRLAKLAQRLREDADRAHESAERRHEARKSGRRLRYTIEHLRPVLSGDVDACLEGFIALQDQIGDRNDQIVAAAFLRDAAPRSRNCAGTYTTWAANLVGSNGPRRLTIGDLVKRIERLPRDS